MGSPFFRFPAWLARGGFRPGLNQKKRPAKGFAGRVTDSFWKFFYGVRNR